jgi:hypothetical protein
LARFKAASITGDEPKYWAKAEEFVREAQAGNVDRMLEITSTYSYAAQTNSLRALYAGQVVQEFDGTSVTWDANGKKVLDDRHNAGFRFKGTASGKKHSHLLSV